MTDLRNVGHKDNNDGQGEAYHWATMDGECVKLNRPKTCQQHNCKEAAEWESPIGNLLCERHAKIMDRLYLQTEAKCVPWKEKSE